MRISHESLQKYPIHMRLSEQDIIKNVISGQRHKISNVWKQLVDKKSETICMNSYEQGVVMAIISDQKDKIPDVWKQLIDMINKFRKDARVEITDLGNNLVQLKDDQGIVIIREKYEWEK